MARPNLRGLRRDANGDLYWALGGLDHTREEIESRVIRTRSDVRVRRPTTTTGEEEGSPAQCADFEDRQNRKRNIGVYKYQAFSAKKKSWTTSDWFTLGAVVLGAVALGAVIVATGGGAAVVFGALAKAGVTGITTIGIAATAATTAKIAGSAAALSWFASRWTEADDVDASNYEVGNAIGDEWGEEHPISDWADDGNEYAVQVSPNRNC
ncbi:MAG: hypothetical protein JKY34_10230 [Kordiimonadaceae bacterium]|nr:hypothetical protein [Kordiimonadaceae bacterium]